MSFVTKAHEDTIDAYELLNTIEGEDIGELLIEVDVDPGDEVTKGFSAVALVFPDDDDRQMFYGFWAETPVEAVEGLINTLTREGFIDV